MCSHSYQCVPCLIQYHVVERGGQPAELLRKRKVALDPLHQSMPQPPTLLYGRSGYQRDLAENLLTGSANTLRHEKPINRRIRPALSTCAHAALQTRVCLHIHVTDTRDVPAQPDCCIGQGGARHTAMASASTLKREHDLRRIARRNRFSASAIIPRSAAPC